jgi:hypothetical protein
VASTLDFRYESRRLHEFGEERSIARHTDVVAAFLSAGAEFEQS